MHNSALVTNAELFLQAMLPRSCTDPRLMALHERGRGGPTSWVLLTAVPKCKSSRTWLGDTWKSWELTHCFSHWDVWLKNNSNKKNQSTSLKP